MISIFIKKSKLKRNKNVPLYDLSEKTKNEYADNVL